MSIFGFIMVGLVGGAILASTGVIGPFLVPALLLLGLSSDMARGTCFVSELLMTLISVIVHKKVGNLDKRVILAFLPGVVTVALGANVSVKFPELFMRLTIGMFETIIGIVMIYTTVKWANKQRSKTVNTSTTMAKLMMVAILAGFTKGFFGAGWGPLGVGLFILLGIDPRLVIGSSLVVRLFVDGVGAMTYGSMNLVDINAVTVLTLAGCVTAPLAVKLTTVASEKTLRMVLGGIITFLGALVIIEAVTLIH